MWESLLNECAKIATNNIGNSQDAEDCIQEVMIKLLNESQNKIIELDECALHGFLKKMLKISIFEKKSKEVARNKTAYWRYKQIANVCEQNRIHPIPQNAYLIAPLMEEEQYTLSAVEKILNDVRPGNISLDCLYDL